MVCTLCGTQNPASNKFCGECGAILTSKPVPEAVPPVAEKPTAAPVQEHYASHFEPLLAGMNDPVDRELAEHEPDPEPERLPEPVRFNSGFQPEGEHYTTISGPSFLGLTDSNSDGTDYLLEEEDQPRSHAGW